MNLTATAAAILLAATAFARADVIEVPADQPTIQAAIAAASDGDEIVVAPGDYTGPIEYAGKTIAIRSSGGPSVTTLTAASSIVICEGGSGEGTLFQGFRVFGADTVEGGGIRIKESSIEVAECVITDNNVEAGGGGLRFEGPGQCVVRDCVFRENSAAAGGGIWGASVSGLLTIVRCDFIENEAGFLGGGVDVFAGAVRMANCRFVDNVSFFIAGGLLINTGGYPFEGVNLAISGSSATEGAGVFIAGLGRMDNCTISGSQGQGVHRDDSVAGSFEMNNCIVWGNTESSVTGYMPGFTINSSNIESGWKGSGSGNTDADPMFVQPGTGDLRLLPGSPSLDAGDAFLLPDDVNDLDGDGDTGEPLPVDLAYGDRIQEAGLDHGAYEGAGAALPPSDVENDLDPGELALLTPGGEPGDPVETGLVVTTNTGTTEDAVFELTEFENPPVPHADFVEVASVYDLQTTLPDGEHFTTVIIPFTLDELFGAGPFDVQLVSASTSLEPWALAVLANTDGQEGSRIEVTGPGNLGLTPNLGDHGVYWDPTIQAGVAWANVDHATEFAVGIGQACPADATLDDEVDDADLARVIDAWGSTDLADPADGHQDVVEHGSARERQRRPDATFDPGEPADVG